MRYSARFSFSRLAPQRRTSQPPMTLTRVISGPFFRCASRRMSSATTAPMIKSQGDTFAEQRSAITGVFQTDRGCERDGGRDPDPEDRGVGGRAAEAEGAAEVRQLAGEGEIGDGGIDRSGVQLIGSALNDHADDFAEA